MRVGWMAIGLALPIAAAAQQGAPAAELARRVDSVARARVPAGFSGVVLLARGDSGLVHRGYGHVNGDAVTLESRFWIASTAKQFVSTAVLLLRDRGLLSLDDTLGRFIRDLPQDKRRISIRQLLTHTSDSACRTPARTLRTRAWRSDGWWLSS